MSTGDLSPLNKTVNPSLTLYRVRITNRTFRGEVVVKGKKRDE